jgi:DNA-binding transcriptional ArsR family regulator
MSPAGARDARADKRSRKILNLTVDSFPFAPILNHMVEYQAPEINSVFHALGDPTRRRMLGALAGGERSVSELAEPFAMSLAAASKHIRVLEHAGLIRREVRGRTHLCRLDPGPLASAYEWLSFYERFWGNSLDELERLLRDEDAAKSTTPKSTSGKGEKR